MRYRIEIKRRKAGGADARTEVFEYERKEAGRTVATALTELNSGERILTADGTETTPVRWDCNCMQKKCGACAMVINGRPALACDARLEELGETVTLRPLSKFPLIEDLAVDRSVMYDNLMKLSLLVEKAMPRGYSGTAYEASKCLQCGLCLEVCPNFRTDGEFFGMSAAAPMSRVLDQSEKDIVKRIRKEYIRHIYNGCGKSLACRNICPAGIDTEKMLVSSNAVAAWKRFSKKKIKE